MQVFLEVPLKKLILVIAACSPVLAVTVAIANNLPPANGAPEAPPMPALPAMPANQGRALLPTYPSGGTAAARQASSPGALGAPVMPAMMVPVASVPPVPPQPEMAGAPAATPASSGRPDALHFSNPELKLTPQEREALALAKKWKAGVSGQGIKPVPGPDGAIRFLFGAMQPSIVCAVLQVCDVELQAGEQVNSLHLGDTARWTVEPAITGTGSLAVQHLIIKPMDTGLETSLIVTTDRRTYHLRLRSHRTEFMPRVAFTYPDEAMAKWEGIRKQEQAAHERQILPGTGEYLGNLDFDYRIEGQASGWKPVRVYNDGVKTIIQMPSTLNQNEAPILLVVRKDGGLFTDEESVQVNYRLQNDRYIVDSLFDKAILVAGAGSSQERVTIKKGNNPW
jgi:type IV secretion system protein VirB9